MSDSTLLAIETSCDETAVAVVKHSQDTISVLGQAVASQIDIHAVTGGVVPEVAAREHVAILPSLLKAVLKESSIKPTQLDAIAVTVGPGLMPALVIGVTAAQTLAYSWDKPIIPIHHLEGHIASALYSPEENSKPSTQSPTKFTIPDRKQTFPALALIVSGGHTMLVLIERALQNPSSPPLIRGENVVDPPDKGDDRGFYRQARESDNHFDARFAGLLEYHVLGSTRDDAAGEAFDKVARLLNMPYPGGPALSQAAQAGNPLAYPFTRPMLRSGDLDFSFSGLKTEVLYKVRELSKDQPVSAFVNDIAASFQAAVVDSLIIKTKLAIAQTKPKRLLLAGGVAANTKLREAFVALATQANVPFNIAPLPLCSDNAVMIGLTAILAYETGRLSDWRDIDAVARPDLSNFSASASTV